jgi:hypothetical protein
MEITLATGPSEAGGSLGQKSGIPGILLGGLIQNPISFAYTVGDSPPVDSFLFQPILLTYIGRGFYLKSAEDDELAPRHVDVVARKLRDRPRDGARGIAAHQLLRHWRVDGLSAVRAGGAADHRAIWDDDDLPAVAALAVTTARESRLEVRRRYVLRFRRTRRKQGKGRVARSSRKYAAMIYRNCEMDY